MLNIKKDEMKNGHGIEHGIEEDGEMKGTLPADPTDCSNRKLLTLPSANANPIPGIPNALPDPKRSEERTRQG